jgi:hypothetical protein
MRTTIARIASGIIVAAGLAAGSAGIAPVAFAETGSVSSRGGSDSRPDRSNKPKHNAHRVQIRNPETRGPVGLNGNRPQSPGKPNQFQYFPKTLDQFKHLPFDPAMPGGD